jgi:ribose/xylose/arabinose/galactoside ABC-type transport system permease subunit
LRPNFISHYGRQLGTLSGLLGLGLVLWALTPHFLTVSNLLNVAEQAAIIAIVAVGMTFVIITGGIDLSVGSVLAFAGVVMASVLHADVPVPLALGAALGTGLFCGLENGALITFGRLPPFIATLGMMSVARGTALMFTEGRPVSGFSGSFRSLATGEVIGVPASVVIMIAVYIVAHFVLTRTKLGRYTYAIGGNEEAALLSGVNVRLYKATVYGISGMLSGLAAVLLTARLNSAQPIAGMMYELDAIAATVIGGTSLLGGEGTVLGTLIGALIMAVLRNGLNILGVSSFVQQVVIGSVIIVAVLIDMWLKRRAQ